MMNVERGRFAIQDSRIENRDLAVNSMKRETADVRRCRCLEKSGHSVKGDHAACLHFSVCSTCAGLS